jgi:hypothetical protein
MNLIGEPVHPQLLIAGFAVDEPAYQAMSQLVQNTMSVNEGFDESKIRIVEWDILVTKGVDLDVSGHMHVLSMGCQSLGMVQTANGGTSLYFGGKQPSAMLQVAADLSDPLRRLVSNELVPWLLDQPFRPFIQRHRLSSFSPTDPLAGPDVRAFVRDADGNMIAGEFPRAGGRGGGFCWALPFVPAEPQLWLAAALDDWRRRTPDRLPLSPGWRTRNTWRPKAEAKAYRALTELASERERAWAEFDRRERDLEASAQRATKAADQGLRRLLTSQGDDLVMAVASALKTLGFQVVDGDATTPQGTAKGEDLRLTDPDDLDWTNITEVRGYAAGAKTNDLQRLARFAAMTLSRTGAQPTTRWYVVNQFLGNDPDTRQSLLPGADEDVEIFAEDGGLILDTRSLFALVRRVEYGEISQEDARGTLKATRGRFHLAAPGT